MKVVLQQPLCEETLNFAATGSVAGRGNVLNESQRCDWHANVLQGFP